MERTRPHGAGRMPTGSRHPTYGYDYDPVSKRRVVNEQEAEVVRWASGDVRVGGARVASLRS